MPPPPLLPEGEGGTGITTGGKTGEIVGGATGKIVVLGMTGITGGVTDSEDGWA